MFEYKIHTLVDITNNGNLKQAFPFKTLAGDVVHDKDSLAIARNQNNNFTTLIQTLQLRSNISWEINPQKLNGPIANYKFGPAYEGVQNSWHWRMCAHIR